MGGTREGGLRTKAANLRKDPDFYKKIGRVGGKITAERGHLAKVNFAADRERARIAGAKGGRISKKKGNGAPGSEHEPR